MKLRDARIGYGGYSRDFSVPGDRRRFAAYASLKGIPIDYADIHRPYDLAYVTYSSDLPAWVARKRRDGDRLKLVFELIDSYFTETAVARRFLKGTARRLLGTDSIWSPDLRRTLIDACSAADAVVCSTEEQRVVIRQFNPNVFLSFDYFADELGPPKAGYGRRGKMRIVWEGQSTTLPNLQVISGPLNALKDMVELHVVTDPRIYRYFGRFSSYPSMDALSGIECDKHFHAWDRATFSAEITACDIAVIPIDERNPLWWAKPENKLVLLWQLGMPVLASATPVYERAMRAAGLEMSCSTAAEWRDRLATLIETNASERGRIGRRCRSHALEAYSKAEFLSRFDRALASIGLEVA